MTSVVFTGVSALIVRAGLSYAAWTQIIPAVLSWLFAIMMLTALALIGMDARGEDPAAGMQAVAERFPGASRSLGAWFEERVTPAIEAATDPETGAVHLDRIDFWGAAAYIWFWLSLGGMAIAYVWRIIFGPRPSRPLRQKLLLTVGACTGYVVALFLVLISLPPSFENDVADWLIISVSAGSIVLAVTSWSVACAHGLGVLADALAPEEVE